MRSPGLLFAFLLIYGFVLAQPAMPRKYALIVAIGDYPAANGWPKISSVRDAEYLQRVLSDQGFKEKDIMTVKDSAATMGGIREAFAALSAKVRRGDIVIVHFSCHGEQVEADNNNKIDGLDECIVTFNAISPFQSKDYQQDQAQYLRGHTLGSYLRALRAKLGDSGDLVVFMDNCHSGDGTRGMARIRGGAAAFVSPNFDPIKHNHSDSSMINRDEIANTTNGAGLSPFEVFSATRPEELDYETTDEKTGADMGSLTYAICKAFSGMSASATGSSEGWGGTDSMPTYRQLFVRIQSIMAQKVPQQHPLLEGNGADRILFGGKFVRQLPYIQISAIDKRTQRITLRQGSLAGLDAGALIAVYQAGTIDTAGKVPLCTGKVLSAGPFASVAAVDRDLPIKQPADGWVVITGRVYKVAALRVQLRAWKKGEDVPTALKDDSTIQFVNESPDLILTRDSLKVAVDGWSFPALPGDGLKEQLERYARYKYLQGLSMSAPGLQMEVRLLLVKGGKPDTITTNKRIKAGRLEVYEGDSLTLYVRNTGTKDAFINILDMQPDGIINKVIPNRELSYPVLSQNLKILAGQDWYLPNGDAVGISPPYGTEVFKIFVADSEFDLEDLVGSAGASRGVGMQNVLSDLLQNSFSLSRGAPTTSVPSSAASISQYVFLIKPKP
jgi:metacaspase-1